MGDSSQIIILIPNMAGTLDPLGYLRRHETVENRVINMVSLVKL